MARQIETCNRNDSCPVAGLVDAANFNLQEGSMTKTPIALDKDVKSQTNTRLAFAILATVQGMLIFTITLIMIPLPVIADEFSLSSSQILLLQVAYGLPFSGLLLFGGRLTDRYGARRMFTIGLTIFGAASFFAPTATSFDVLIAMRFLQGVAGAIVAPAALGVVRSLYPDMAGFGRAMAIWGGVSVVGAVLGFMSSGMLVSLVSWRWMFAVPVAVSFLGLFTALSLLPTNSPVDRTQRPGLDPLGALLATSGIVLSSYALIASGEAAWLSTDVLAPLVSGILFLIAFLIVERQLRDPLLPPSFLRNPVRLIGLAGMLIAAASSTLIKFVLLLYLQQMRGWTSFETLPPLPLSRSP